MSERCLKIRCVQTDSHLISQALQDSVRYLKAVVSDNQGFGPRPPAFRTESCQNPRKLPRTRESTLSNRCGTSSIVPVLPATSELQHSFSSRFPPFFASKKTALVSFVPAFLEFFPWPNGVDQKRQNFVRIRSISKYEMQNTPLPRRWYAGAWNEHTSIFSNGWEGSQVFELEHRY